MVSNESELSAKEVIPELQDCPLGGQRFLLDSGVTLFRWGQLSADVDHRVFLTVLYLGEDGSQPGVGGVRLQQEGAVKVWGSQYRLRGECRLHSLERLIFGGTPGYYLRLPLPGQVCQGSC